MQIGWPSVVDQVERGWRVVVVEVVVDSVVLVVVVVLVMVEVVLGDVVVVDVEVLLGVVALTVRRNRPGSDEGPRSG